MQAFPPYFPFSLDIYQVVIKKLVLSQKKAKKQKIKVKLSPHYIHHVRSQFCSIPVRHTPHSYSNTLEKQRQVQTTN